MEGGAAREVADAVNKVDKERRAEKKRSIFARTCSHISQPSLRYSSQEREQYTHKLYNALTYLL
jgi:hypothetical protein